MQGRGRATGPGVDFWNVEAHRHTSTKPPFPILPKQFTNWGQDIHIYEPMEAILIQTTTGSDIYNMYSKTYNNNNETQN